jgi:3-isopropylmalate/(R)-2-methylmalate dehydratase small subunit
MRTSLPYGRFLLHDLREGDAAFPLDRHPEASVLVTGRNFGCGSSREAAVYALVDAGVRVVAAESFAGNAETNGFLTARIGGAAALLERLASGPLPARADIAAGTLTVGGGPRLRAARARAREADHGPR